MKTTAPAINRVVYLLKVADDGVGVPVYKRNHPTDESLPDKYYVVNALPIGKGVLQSCIVNVNFHAKDIGPGMDDTEAIEAGQEAAISRLHIVNDSSELGIYIEYDGEETIANEKKGEHYSNMRFKVIIKNK